MAIRAATEADLPQLLPLLRAYCEFYEADPPDEGLAQMVREVITAAETEAFALVATAEEAPNGGGETTSAGGAVVGFALNQWKWSSLRGARVVVLDDLFVDPKYRGAGHADALIAASAAVARRHDAPVLVWLTAPENHRAQAVYNRVGGKAEPFIEYELEL